MGASVKFFSWPAPGRFLISFLVFTIIPLSLFAADGTSPANEIDTAGSIVAVNVPLENAMNLYREGNFCDSLAMAGQFFKISEKTDKLDLADDEIQLSAALLEALIFHNLGEPEKAQAICSIIYEKFPGGRYGASAGLLKGYYLLFNARFQDADAVFASVAEHYLPGVVSVEASHWRIVTQKLENAKDQPRPKSESAASGDPRFDFLKERNTVRVQPTEEQVKAFKEWVEKAKEACKGVDKVTSHEKTIEYLLNALKVLPGGDAGIENELAELTPEGMAVKREDAKTIWKHIIDCHPDDAMFVVHANNCLANTAIMEGDGAAALKYFQANREICLKIEESEGSLDARQKAEKSNAEMGIISSARLARNHGDIVNVYFPLWRQNRDNDFGRRLHLELNDIMSRWITAIAATNKGNLAKGGRNALEEEALEVLGNFLAGHN